jgi:hypothetical protein
MARRMTPAAPAAIHGRERSKVRIATLKPLPSPPMTALAGTRTSSSRMSQV